MLDLALLIDDDPISILVCETMIRKAAFSKEVKSFGSGTEALAFLDAHFEQGQGLPDIIFLDVRMPKMDGWDFLEKYGSLASLPEKRPHVVMLSAAYNDEDEQRAEEFDVVIEAVVKPLSSEILNRLSTLT